MATLTPAQISQANQGSIDAANAANAASGKIASAPAAGSAFVNPSGQAAPVSTNTSPVVVSSQDSAGQFQTNSTALTNKTTQQTFTTPSGAVVDATGNVITPAPAATNADGTPKTAVEQGAAAGAGSGAEPDVTTGNPILDSLQAWEQTQDAAAAQTASDQKAQVASMLQTNLANNDSAAAAQIQSITDTYSNLIDTQTRINNLNINRTKAYGLASGNALATPLEYTNAVSAKESDAMAQIQTLDNSRDDAIAQAKAAQASGDAKLLQDSMDQVDTIESNMQSTLASLASEVTNRATLLNQVETQQKADQAAQSQKLLAAATAQYGTQFASLTDPTQQDAMIKNIVAQSNGMLDYGSVYGSLQAAAATASAAKTQSAKDASSLALQAAQTNEANASAAKTYADASKSAATTPSDVFGAIDKLLGTKDSSGMPYIEASTGYFTKGGYQTLLNAAAENGVDKAAFLAQYGSYLDPNAYANYGLTKADQDTLTNTNKVTPIVIPGVNDGTSQSTQSGG